jgi:hypothetical protein
MLAAANNGPSNAQPGAVQLCLPIVSAVEVTFPLSKTAIRSVGQGRVARLQPVGCGQQRVQTAQRAVTRNRVLCRLNLSTVSAVVVTFPLSEAAVGSVG